ncbi:MAG: hypothetical protein QOF79_576 [Actinomycetota bacterium]|jgi:hypothetical protein|nr:hypothetical protein [Actinomycetota bacterium]
MTRSISLPRSTPESQGVSSHAILDFVTAVEQQLDSVHSFMLMRHGNVIAEGWWSPFAPQLPHTMFSLSKSFTSTAVGLAVSAGLLTVDDRIVDLFPDDLPATVSDRLGRLRVKHLLTMSTGHASESMEMDDRGVASSWVQHILSRPLEFEPGTHFIYNSGATYLLSAIVQKLTGQRVLDYLTPRLFEPLGIEGATWEQSPQGIDVGGWGLAIRTEDIANFGQLYLQGGQWGGQQVIPAAWVAEATRWQVANDVSQTNPDWIQGYGYQFWQSQHAAYRGDGAFGQFCVVLPEQDAVIVMTAGVADMQAQLDLVWEYLLPAMNDDSTSATATDAAQTALGVRLDGLALATQPGSETSALAPEISGARFEFDDGATATLTIAPGGSVLSLSAIDLYGDFAIGYGEWITGEADAFEGREFKVAGSGAWTDPSTYVARLQFYETPFATVVTLAFDRDAATIDIRQNVAFGATHLLHAVGRRVAE